ncbi:MAG: hypothetical protein A2Y94_04090 [Caldithrix sp. RBG_13_44_9]|nr:MAG: hypothetical protein A2Y94_04090 [Caldithrix sp. RBG_13_44_9]
MMKLPSVQQVLQNAVRTFLRFPFVLSNTLLGTIAVVILVDHEGPTQATFLFNILLATILGIPLLTGFVLFAEKKKWGRGKALGLQLVGVVLLVAYGYTVPSDLGGAPAIHILRLLIITAALHLFVAFAPYSGRAEINGFWHYNKTLLLRLIITLVYSVVLYAGLALALAALDNLFGMDVPGKRYAELWFIILGLFNTWSFLAGIPENLDQLEKSTDYPKGIKIFAQYILLPLVLVYLAILYAYLAKILISWNWPQGWVSRLILGFATTGIFSFLLLYPVSNRDENIWIKTAARWFYVAMIPLVIMLLLALWRRISEYGITEGRYIAIVLGIWLGGIVLYFILSNTKSIKAIPISLGVFALIISFGPWGAFTISEKSQVNRLQGFLTRNQILVEGSVQKAPAPVPQNDSQQISSILSYLHDIHGYDRIQLWYQESLREDSLGVRLQPKDPALVARMMGIEYINVWYSSGGNDIWLGSDQGGIIDVQGYDRMIRGQHISVEQDKKVFTDQEFIYRVNSGLDTITFTITPSGKSLDSLQIDLHPLINQLLSNYGNLNVNNIPPEKIMLNTENQHLKVKIYFRYIRLIKEDNIIKTMEYGADILYRINKE